MSYIPDLARLHIGHRTAPSARESSKRNCQPLTLPLGALPEGTGTVTLSGAASSGGITVTLTSRSGAASYSGEPGGPPADQGVAQRVFHECASSGQEQRFIKLLPGEVTSINSCSDRHYYLGGEIETMVAGVY
jgi:hypothetical protein